jgi:hypothetical protein
MKRRGVLTWGMAALFFCAAVCLAESGDLSAEDIVRKANHMSLYQGDDCRGRVTLTITDKQGRVRKREFNMLRKDADASDTDQKYFVFFHEPADIRKMVFIVHKQVFSGKDDDRWLYMPNLDLVKRIAASDKRTSFVGSDFLYEDISGRSPSEDIHELVETTESHHVLKSRPIKPEAVEFAYYVSLIDKKTFLPSDITYFRSDDRPYRRIRSIRVESVEADEKGVRVDYPTVTLSFAEDLDTGGRTEMAFSRVRYNTGLTEDLFSERYLRRPPKDVVR